MTTQAGRATVPADHPNFVLGFGPAGDAVRREADVLLVAASRMGNLDLPYDQYWGDPSGQRLIQIDIDARHLGVSRPLTLGILSDANIALTGIAARLRAMDLPAADEKALARHRALDQETRLAQAAPILQWQGPGIHPAHAIGAVGAVFGPDAVYTVDGVYTYASGESLRARLYLQDGLLRKVYGFVGDAAASAPREIYPHKGDRFTVYERWLDLDQQGRVIKQSAQEGGTLTFGDEMFTWVELDAAAG